MYTNELLKESQGFDFSLYERNEFLLSSQGKNNETPQQKDNSKYKKGTTICAVTHKDGIVFAADTRATAGTVVMDLDCLKLHKISDNIIFAGAGTAADLFSTVNMLQAELQLLKMNTGCSSRITHVENRLSDHLFRHMGHIGVHSIFGGVDINGTDLVRFLK